MLRGVGKKLGAGDSVLKGRERSEENWKGYRGGEQEDSETSLTKTVPGHR